MVNDTGYRLAQTCLFCRFIKDVERPIIGDSIHNAYICSEHYIQTDINHVCNSFEFFLDENRKEKK
jgi:hypothetical protein